MKIISTKLILLASITLMTACSTHSPKPKSSSVNNVKLTTLEIMGISKSKKIPNSSKVVTTIKRPDAITLLPMATTYPLYPMIENRVYNNYVQENSFNSPIEVFSEVSSVELSNVEQEVEENAKRLLGVKYVWGATGPYTYDCSGFTQKIYRDAGINIPRVSRDQARVGQYVSYNNLQRGDMVFFDTHKKRTGKVSHVGIYLGDGNFIHASSAAKKVVIFNFNEKTFYKKRFLWGRRVIQDNYFMASL